MSIEHADFDGIERLAFVLGGEIVSTFDHPDKVKLGHCDLIEEVLVGDEKMLKFSGTLNFTHVSLSKLKQSNSIT